jgi:hypothetical protein
LAEPAKSEFVAVKVEQAAPAKSQKAVHKRKPAQVARPGQGRERYAGYPPDDFGNIW